MEEKNKITRPNFTQIPNVVFDHWMAILTPAEFKVLLCICRKTFGWHKEKDRISLKQIADLTGLSRQSVINNIENLIAAGLVVKFKKKDSLTGDEPNCYEICVHEIEDEEVGGSTKFIPPQSTELTTPLVNSVDPQKKDFYTKEKDICADFVDAPKSFSSSSYKKKKFTPDPSITPEQHKKLVDAYGKELTESCYKHLAEWKESKAQVDPKALDMHSDYHRIRKWVIQAVQEQKTAPKAKENYRSMVENKFKNGEQYGNWIFYNDHEKVSAVPAIGQGQAKEFFFKYNDFIEKFEIFLTANKLMNHWKK